MTASEHTIQNTIRNALADDCFIFRANVGRAWQGVPVRGMAHPITVVLNPGDVLLRKARPFDAGPPPGFSDLFGWREVTITPDMVGQRVAVFVGVECKSETGKARERQVAFVDAVNRSGGRAGFARSVQDARDIIEGRGSDARIGVQTPTPADRRRGAR